MVCHSNSKHIVCAWLPVFVYAAVIFYLSSIPGLKLVSPVTIPYLDKVVHFFEFAVFEWLLLRTYPTMPPQIRFYHFVVWTVVIAMLYALSDEIHQAFVPGRHANWSDWCADTLGIVTFATLFYRFKQKP